MVVLGGVSSSDRAEGARALQKMVLALSRAQQSDYLAFLHCIPNEQGMLCRWLAAPMLPGTKPSWELRQEQGTACCFPALPLPSSQPFSTEGSRRDGPRPPGPSSALLNSSSPTPGSLPEEQHCTGRSIATHCGEHSDL